MVADHIPSQNLPKKRSNNVKLEKKNSNSYCNFRLVSFVSQLSKVEVRKGEESEMGGDEAEKRIKVQLERKRFLRLGLFFFCVCVSSLLLLTQKK